MLDVRVAFLPSNSSKMPVGKCKSHADDTDYQRKTFFVRNWSEVFKIVWLCAVAMHEYTCTFPMFTTVMYIKMYSLLWILHQNLPNLHNFFGYYSMKTKDQPMIGSDIGSGRFLAISVKHRIGKMWLSLPIRVPMFGLMKNSALIWFNYTQMPCFLIECE